MFQFNPESPLVSEKNPGYNPDPSPEDKVHVLVCVLSANAAEIPDSVLKKMAEVRKLASDLGKNIIYLASESMKLFTFCTLL